MPDQAPLELSLRVNGRDLAVRAEPWLTAAALLRDRLGLVETKLGCGTGDCGACTVLMDGTPLLACLLLAAELQGLSVTTIAGLAADGLSPLQQAFLDETAYQCGFCTPGMILAATAVAPGSSEEAVREALAGNLCRCTGYTTIVAAVRRAAA